MDIVPKVVKKVAKEREAAHAAAQFPLVAPRQIAPVRAPVSVVDPDATTVSAMVTAAKVAAVVPALGGVVVPAGVTVAGVVSAAANAVAGVAAATAADVVTVAEAAASVLNPRLPALAPAGGLPLAPGTLQNLLSNGEWGNALIGLV
ncbi:MAG: hypothetical protein LBD34_00895 [Puniceicoccales bacterium]|nr:hypothetical protein [Puniceicoccales bacterium]